MTAALDLTPADGWTIDDLDELPADGRRRELIDGVLHLPPTPSHSHQTLAMLLGARLHASCPRDYTATQAVEVRLNPYRVFIPDVLVVTTAAAAKNPTRYWAHDVLLAVEIVSKTSISMDRITKPALYAEAQIPFYWRIETADGVAVHTHRLGSGGVYVETGVHRTVIDTAEPWPINIPISEIHRGQ